MSAREVLDKGIYLSSLSDEFKDDLVKMMVSFDAPEGHVFIKEGDPINSFLIVDSGSLVRTKIVSEGEPPLEIDVIGVGKVTGFLHVAGHANEDLAFATVSAGKKGGAKVWVVGGGHFRKMCEDNPKYSSEVINLLTVVLRQSTKVVRAVVNKNKDDSAGSADDKEKKVLKILCFDSTSWTRENFEPQIETFNNNNGTNVHLQMDYTQDRLDVKTAKFSAGYDGICLFVNDTADVDTLWVLSMCGVKLILMRCAGFDRVDIKAAKAFNMSVARVPAYSPYAVAEHAITLLMSVNRKIAAASVRVKMSDFSLDTSLLGMDIHGKTVGVMGTGKIGQILCKIINGFGVNLLAYDVFESDVVKSLGGKYVSKEAIYENCDVIFLMMPLLPATKHTINESVLPLLKKGVLIVNTSRGGLIDTKALVSGLQSDIIGGCGLDVYENEGDYFFRDWSGKAVQDSTLTTLLGSNRVVMTAHQAFFTREAIDKIVSTTIENACNYGSGLRGDDLPNSIC